MIKINRDDRYVAEVDRMERGMDTMEGGRVLDRHFSRLPLGAAGC